jgi:hypothetical protein
VTGRLAAAGYAAIGVAMLVATLATDARAQPAAVTVAAGVRMEGYAFADAANVGLERISLLTAPFSASFPLLRNLELGVNGAFARGSAVRAGGTELMLSGLTDTELRLTAAFAQDRLRLALVALLPTGQSELSDAEMSVAGIIAADLLPFAISNWGSGGGIGLNAAAATPIGYNMAAALSAGFVMAGEYEPIADPTFAYRPGNQLHVRAALDRTIGSAGKASLQLTYLQFSPDRVAGDNIYQSGDRLQVAVSYALAAGATGSALLYAGYLRRSTGEYTNAALLTPAQDLIYAGAGMRYTVASITLVPALDLRVVGNEAGVEQGYTITAGTGIEVPLGSVLVAPTLRARLGNLTVSEGQESSFTGFELGLALRTRGSH